MTLCIISFTEKGVKLSEKIADKSGVSYEVALYTKCSSCDGNDAHHTVCFVDGSIQGWARKQMEEKNILLFIGACGIAVRAIAPWVGSKLSDSPVLVMDEKADYIIPILSGHVGGANEIAVDVAKQMGAVPVITTATDINGLFAVDLFAKENGLHIVNKDAIAKVSAKVLAGENITMAVEAGHMDEGATIPKEIRIVPYPPSEEVDILVTTENIEAPSLITLRPKEYVIGMGCKKGKEVNKIGNLIQKSLEEIGVSLEQIYGLCSIDNKKEEEGFLSWSGKMRVPFVTFSAEQLQNVKGVFHDSEFVKEQVGVDNVCERAAIKGCDSTGDLIFHKHAEDGMTIAIAKRDWRVSFDEE